MIYIPCLYTDIPTSRSFLRFFTKSLTKKGSLDLGNAPVDIQYVNRKWQRKDDESRILDGLGKMGAVDRPQTL